MAGLRVKTLFHPNGEIRVLPEQASTLPVKELRRGEGSRDSMPMGGALCRRP